MVKQGIFPSILLLLFHPTSYVLTNCVHQVQDSLGDIHLINTTSIATHTHQSYSRNSPPYPPASCVFKAGAVDDYRGYLNGIKSRVALDYRKGESSAETSEWLIVGHESVQAFAKKGHSGYFVMMEEDATVAGMVIGGVLKLPFLTYATELNEILEDVEIDQNLSACTLA